jgi:hypothetical protein
MLRLSLVMESAIDIKCVSCGGSTKVGFGWVWLYRVWPLVLNAMVLVKPATVVEWHRRGFRLYWRRWRSRRLGRPKMSAEIRDLVRQMSLANRQRIVRSLATYSYLLQARSSRPRGGRSASSLRTSRCVSSAVDRHVLFPRERSFCSVTASVACNATGTHAWGPTATYVSFG